MTRCIPLLLAALATAPLLLNVGCVGAKYRPLIASGPDDDAATPDCQWVETLRDDSTDSRLMWCCGPQGDPLCTEASFVESQGRQLSEPFRQGLPPMDSEATVTEMSEGGRLLGLGTNLGLGFGHRQTTTAIPDADEYDAHLDLELPGFEVRLFPADHFSFDFLWRIGNAAWAKDRSRSVTMMFLTHFYSDRRSVAPGVIFGQWRDSDVKIVGFVLRLGGEVTNPEKTFGFGVHFRPAVTLTGYPGDEPQPGAELMAEFNWTFYIPRPAEM